MSSSHVTALCSYPHSLHSSPDTLRFTPTFLYLVMIRFNAIGHAVYKVEVLSPVCLSVRNRIRYSIYPLASESPQSDFSLFVALDSDTSSHRADTRDFVPDPDFASSSHRRSSGLIQVPDVVFVSSLFTSVSSSASVFPSRPSDRYRPLFSVSISVGYLSVLSTSQIVRHLVYYEGRST